MLIKVITQSVEAAILDVFLGRKLTQADWDNGFFRLERRAVARSLLALFLFKYLL